MHTCTLQSCRSVLAVQEAHEQLNCAVDEYGLNFIDTAEICEESRTTISLAGRLAAHRHHHTHTSPAAPDLTQLASTTALHAPADPVPPAAETQGLTERYIGSWLRGGGGGAHPRRREDVVLATKVSGFGRQVGPTDLCSGPTHTCR